MASNASLIYNVPNFIIRTGTIPYSIARYTDCVDNLEVKIGSTTVATRTNVAAGESAGISATISFTSSELTAIYNAMPKVTSATFTFILTSTVDGVTIGTSTATATGRIPDDIKPKLNSVSLVESVAGIAAKFGGFVKNKSMLKYSYNITPATGATITSYQLTLDGSIYAGSTGTTNTLKTDGALTYTAYIVDSRGRRSETVTGSINVLDYTSPQILLFDVTRCNAQGVETNDGTYAKYSVYAEISPVNSKNDKSFLIEYKALESDTWVTWKSYNAGYELNETSTVLAITDEAYQFRLTVKDYFNTNNPAIANQSLSSAFTILDVNADGTGIAFGGVSTKQGYQFFGEIYDKNDKAIRNGLAYYEQSGDADPNTTLEELVLTTANTPISGTFFYIRTIFYNSKSTTANRTQIAYPYNGAKGSYYRYYTAGIGWSAWQSGDITSFVHADTNGHIRFANGLLIQWGRVAITPTAANTVTNITVNFPIAFDEVPKVNADIHASVPNAVTVSVGGTNAIAKESMVIYMTRTNTTATVFQWQAIGFKEVA